MTKNIYPHFNHEMTKKYSIKTLRKLTKGDLYRLYHQENLSTGQIANKLCVGKTSVIRYLHKHNIKIRCSKDGQMLRLLKDGKFGGYLIKKLNERQTQFTLGTLLGDGTLWLGKRSKNARMKIQHSGKDMEYIKFKRDLLNDFVTGLIRKDTHNNKKVNKTYHSYYFVTKTHPEFTKFYRQFYKDCKKILTKSVLQQLSPFGLAIWIMDDGHYNKKGKYMDIYSMSFTEEENQVIIEWFKERFGIKPSINFHKQCQKTYLRFNQEDTKKLIKIIKPHVIESMKRKIA